MYKVSGYRRVVCMKRGHYLQIKEAAAFLGVASQTLRRWDETGQLAPDIRNLKTGYRYYSIENLERYEKNMYEENRKDPVAEFLPYSFDFIDLFSGIGGIRLPFEKLGGRCVFSSEIDPACKKTYRYIFDEEPHDDITKIGVEEIPPHDVLLAGFPCQPFSVAGVSKYNSLGWEHGFEHKTKGTLFFHIARILKAHRPKAFLLENVKNLKSHDHGKTFSVIMDTLKKDLNYTVVEHKIIDARHFLPQHRERIFIVGFRDDIQFSFPELSARTKSLKDILDPAPDPKYTLSDKLWDYLQRYADKHRAKGNGFGYGLADPENPDAVTRTLSARYHKDGSEILIPRPDGNPRRLTPAECARLMGFPPEYESLPVSDTQAYRQFGNAVVVPVIASLAREIIKSLRRAYPPSDAAEISTPPLVYLK